MDCNTAIQIMLDAQHGQTQLSQRRRALNHILQDPECLARLDQFARALLTDLEDEMPCAEVRRALAAYYELSQAGGHVQEEMPAIHGHVQRCPYCQLELHLLEQTMNLTNNNQLPALETLAPFDLSFINDLVPNLVPPLVPAVPAPNPIWIIDEKVRALFRQLEINIQPKVAAIATLRPELTPRTFAMSMRGEDDAQFAVLVLPDKEAQIRFKLDAKPTPDGAALISLRIFELLIDKPIPDVRVTLRTADRNLVAGSLTDANGKIEFPRIAPNQYLIQAQHADMIWELPIAITCV